MKVRKEITGSKNDNWETPKYIMDFVEKYFNGQGLPLTSCRIEGGEYFIKFNGLAIDWKKRNYVNPPYNITDKPKFIKKAYEEYLKGNTSILLIPATTETKWFHDYLVPHAQIFFIKGRVKFRGYNSKNEYVTNKTGQSGSMLCILDPNKSPKMEDLEIKHTI